MSTKYIRGFSSLILIIGIVAVLGAVAAGTAVVTKSHRDVADGTSADEGATTPAKTQSNDQVENPTVKTENPSVQASVISDPADIILSYYRALNDKRYTESYAMWESFESWSQQTFGYPPANYNNVRGVVVKITGATQIDGAAGSSYATVPVEVELTLIDGEKQLYRGSYTLRRSNIVPPSESKWKIYSPNLKQEGTMTYRNEKYNFAFDHSSGAKLANMDINGSEADPNSRYFVVGLGKNAWVYFDVYNPTTAENRMTLLNFVKLVTEDEESIKSETIGSGVAAVKVDFNKGTIKMGQNGELVENREVIFVKGNDYYLKISPTLKSFATSEDKEAVSNILASFRFTR